MDEHREGIQAEKPVQPWERPGCFRRDCEPHRGDMLWWLGCAGFVLGNLAMIPCFAGLPNLLSIPLGLTTWMLARSDLAKMQKGVMDPRLRLTSRCCRQRVRGYPTCPSWRTR
jgi:hypothetical protein